MQSKVTRPVALVFIMVYTLVISLIHLVGGVGPVFKGANNALALILGLLYLFMGMGGFAAVPGLWMMHAWANLLTRVIFCISIPIGIFAMLKLGSGANNIIQLMNIGLEIWIVWYLMRAPTKALFVRN